MSRASITRRSWSCALVAALLVALLTAFTNAARPARPEGAANEYQVKAAFLLNFAKYVKWPERTFTDANAPIVVAILGADPFGKTLEDTLRGKVAGSRKLEVRRFKNLNELGACHILFVASPEVGKLTKVLEQCSGMSVLVVGETDKFAAHGGAIGFVIEDNKVRFEINPDAAKRFELEISSQLMKLARIVKEDAGAR